MKKVYGLKLCQKKHHDMSKPLPKRHFLVDVKQYIPSMVEQHMRRRDGTCFLFKICREDDVEAQTVMNIAACVREYRAAGKEKEDLYSIMHSQVELIYDESTTSEEESEDDAGEQDTPSNRMSSRKNLTGKYSSKKRDAVSETERPCLYSARLTI